MDLKDEGRIVAATYLQQVHSAGKRRTQPENLFQASQPRERKWGSRWGCFCFTGGSTINGKEEENSVVRRRAGRSPESLGGGCLVEREQQRTLDRFLKMNEDFCSFSFLFTAAWGPRPLMQVWFNYWFGPPCLYELTQIPPPFPFLFNILTKWLTSANGNWQIPIKTILNSLLLIRFSLIITYN